MTKAVNVTVGGLTSKLYSRMQHFESQMEVQIKTPIQQHLDSFQKKWQNSMTQLQPASVDGVISVAEGHIRRSVQNNLEKIWWDRIEEEDKIMLNKYETLSSTVERWGRAIVNLREKFGSAASTVSGRSTIDFAALVISSALTPTCLELRGWGVCRNIRETGITISSHGN